MSDLTKQLIDAAYDRIGDHCPHPAGTVGLVNDMYCRPCLTQAEEAAQAVLVVLVDKAFPDDEVDYVYACEELAMDAADTLRAMRGEPR